VVNSFPVRTLILAVIMAAGAGSDAGHIEHLRGIYLQQAIEIATIGDRPILLTRMTRFWRCGSRRGLAQDYNAHIVEVVGRDVPGIGFVAGIVNAVEGCDEEISRHVRDTQAR
jgi:hypothetical protein